MKAFIIAAGLTLALSSPAAAQYARVPDGPWTSSAQHNLRPEVRDRLSDTLCIVDPAVTAVTVTKLGGDQYRVAYEVANRGRSAWRSGANQQTVVLTTRNGSSGRAFSDVQSLTGAAGGRASMGRFSSPAIADAFDDFEFGGLVEVSIAYDPDIAIDGNRCNDDSNSGNNTLAVEGEALMAFLKSRAISRTFR